MEREAGRKATPEKRPGVTINRRDLIAVPVPDANLLWRVHRRSPSSALTIWKHRLRSYFSTSQTPILLRGDGVTAQDRGGGGKLVDPRNVRLGPR